LLGIVADVTPNFIQRFIGPDDVIVKRFLPEEIGQAGLVN
jgi:hypothetical protein